jgi:predicted nucleotidyltransferase
MNALDNLTIHHQEKIAIMEASKVLREKFRAEEVILFGSKARGDDNKESDIDLLVLTTEPITWNERKAINNALYEIQLKYDVIISPLITTVSKWAEGPFSVLPIHDEVSAQGIIT